MSEGKSGMITSGAGLVWRRQRLVWWIFVVNLVLAGLAVRGVHYRIGEILNHSLASAKLLHGMDAGMLQLLASNPSAPFSSQAGYLYYGVYLVFLLFITGGVLEAYRRDAGTATGEFFEACGSFFWRMLRLMLVFLLTLIPVAIVMGIFFAAGNRLSDKTISDLPGRWMYVIGAVLGMLVLAGMRLWFDMAEVYTVAHNERKIRLALKETCKLLWRKWPALYGMFVGITILSGIVFYGGFWVWERVAPPTAIVLSLLWLQALVLLCIGMRLWKRACETAWYQRYQAEQVAAHEPPKSPAPSTAMMESMPAS
jgi:hypothetical protein